jgi:hypothetical protein
MTIDLLLMKNPRQLKTKMLACKHFKPETIFSEICAWALMVVAFE